MTFLTAALIFCLDRLTKCIVTANMDLGQSIKVWPNVFHITYVLNNGTAFGLLKGYGAFLAILSLFVVMFIIAYTMKNKKAPRPMVLALGLVLGGAAGNLVDRIASGRVIDFLDFRVWPVFNIADSAITAGAAILVFSMLKRQKSHSG